MTEPAPEPRCFADVLSVPPSSTSSLPIFVRYCIPQGPIRGRVVISHGVSEHSGRYEHVMRALAQRGWASAAPDHQGHGRSATNLALSPSMDRLADDLGRVRTQLLSHAGPGPVALWGHSMGALVAILHLASSQHDYSCAVLASPATQVPPHVPRVLIAAADRLSKWVPKVPLLPPNRSSYLTRDPEMAKKTDEDPLMYKGGMRAATGTAILKGILRVPSIAPTLRLPVLVTHGDKDKIMPCTASKSFFQVLGAPDKTLRIYEGWIHELHNEPQRARYLEETLAWLDERGGVGQGQDLDRAQS